MRKFLFLGLALSLTTAVVLAQSHNNDSEKTVKQRITFATDVSVGGTVLKAGEYRVQCDREKITFNGSGGKGEFPCQGEELSAPSDRNEVHTSQGSNGTRTLSKLLLKGSNIVHVFQ